MVINLTTLLNYLLMTKVHSGNVHHNWMGYVVKVKDTLQQTSLTALFKLFFCSNWTHNKLHTARL